MATPGQSLSESLACMAKALGKRPYDKESPKMTTARRCQILANTVLPPSKKRQKRVRTQEPGETLVADNNQKQRDEDSKQQESKKETSDSTEAKTKQKEKTDPTEVLVQQLQEQRDQLEKDIDQIQQKRNSISKKQKELWGVYKYGLKKISELNELHEAPDAILPGNF